MELEVATTACVRPELLKKTYKSLDKVLVDVDLKEEGILYINIDPVPVSDDKKIEEELEVARSYFNEVHYNIGVEGGSFSRAVKWIFDQPENDYFFHCEDDWRFYDGKIVIQDYIDKMENDERGNMLQCVTYRNGGGNRVHFPPSLYNKNVLRSILDDHPIPEGNNPEQWIKGLKMHKGVVDYNVISHSGVKREDLGRDWQNKRGISRGIGSTHPARFEKWNLSNYQEK